MYLCEKNENYRQWKCSVSLLVLFMLNGCDAGAIVQFLGEIIV